MPTPEQRVLKMFIDYQQEYKDYTQDYAPGNRYWGDKFMTIIGEAKKVLTANTGITCEICGDTGEDRFFEKCLNCTPAEDECNLPDRGINRVTTANCECAGCNKIRNQIALRKLKEYARSIPDGYFALVGELADWLREDK